MMCCLTISLISKIHNHLLVLPKTTTTPRHRRRLLRLPMIRRVSWLMRYDLMRFDLMRYDCNPFDELLFVCRGFLASLNPPYLFLVKLSVVQTVRPGLPSPPLPSFDGLISISSPSSISSFCHVSAFNIFRGCVAIFRQYNTISLLCAWLMYHPLYPL